METVLILLWQKIQAGAIRRLLIWRIDAKWFNEKGHLLLTMVLLSIPSPYGKSLIGV